MNDFNQATNEVYEDDYGADGIDYSGNFTTDRVFGSSQDAFSWAFKLSLTLGFGIKRGSNKKVGRDGILGQDYFECRRGGRRPENNDADTLMRSNTATGWCKCKFKLKAVQIQREPSSWVLVALFGFHNHAMTVYRDGDSRYHAKFDREELDYIDAQIRAHVKPAIINAGLHQRNPEKPRPNRRQIYNRSQKVRSEEREGRNPAQQMLALAVQHKYVHFWEVDPETQELTHVFMAHPEAVKMFRSYYYVLQIDSTYKTNNNVISDEITTEKMWEYGRLRGDVITYFERLLTVVDYASLSNLCANAGLNIIAEYQDHLADQPVEIEAVDAPQDFGSSSSSEEDNSFM